MTEFETKAREVIEPWFFAIPEHVGNTLVKAVARLMDAEYKRGVEDAERADKAKLREEGLCGIMDAEYYRACEDAAKVADWFCEVYLNQIEGQDEPEFSQLEVSVGAASMIADHIRKLATNQESK